MGLAQGKEGGNHQDMLRALLPVNRGVRTLLERLAIPDHALAGVAREFEILGEFEGVGRARIFAQTAEHAAAEVIGEVHQLFAARLFVALAGHYDEVFRTSKRAQIAGDAKRFVSIRWSGRKSPSDTAAPPGST